MQQSRFQTVRQLLFSTLFLAICGSFILLQAGSSVYARNTVSTHRFVQLIPNVTCTTKEDQSVYATYTSIQGPILFRVGYENTPAREGYGYCHVLAGHPEALPTTAYILNNGRVVASSTSSLTIRGTYTDGKEYQVYLVLSNNKMDDGQMRGIVSVYPYTAVIQQK